jgi:hypothetical protein
MRRLGNSGGIVVALALAIAALFAAPAAPRDPALLAWLAAGGSADGLCGPGGSHAEGRHCDGCRLGAPATALPPAAVALGRVGVAVAAAAVAEPAARRGRVATGWRPRGPPAAA